MPNHHFISYSVANVADFALKLRDPIAAYPDMFEVNEQLQK